MDKSTYEEAIECLNSVITYTKFMSRAENSDNYNKFFGEYDVAYERLINILREEIDESK